MLVAYADAIPAVRAEESLSRIVDGRAGASPMKKAAAQRHIRQLERAATAHQRPRPADPNKLRSVGIGVEFRRGRSEPA